MLTDEEIDRLFDGTSAWIPTELADKVPTYGRKRDGREIAVLVWLLIHQTESSKRQSPVPIHTECFKALGCSFDTVVKVKKWLVEHGFISVSDSYSPGWYSKNYATLHGRASSEFIFEVKSANQAMYRRTAPELASSLSRTLLDDLELDVSRAKAIYSDLGRKRNQHTLNGLTVPLRQLHYKKGGVHRGELGNRLISPLVFVKRTFRECLSLQGERLVCVDMQCCQPTLLAYEADDKKLIESCYNDELYDMIAEEVGTNRDGAKKVYCEYSYGPTRSRNTAKQQAFRVQEMIAREFPKTSEYVQRAKQYNYRTFSRRLQRKEADLFIDECLIPLSLKQIPVLSVHDCLVTTEKYLPTVQEFAKNKITDKGIKRMKLKQEPFIETEGKKEEDIL